MLKVLRWLNSQPGFYDAFDPDGNAQVSFSKDSSDTFNVSVTIDASDTSMIRTKLLSNGM